MTHTYATLSVTRRTFNEVKRRLREAGYHHVLLDEVEGEPTLIDMHGIALVMEEDGEERSNDRSGTVK